MTEAARIARDEPDRRVVAGPIRRLNADMIDDWLLGRLEKVWPGLPKVYWCGRFLGFQTSNDYLVICNDRAVLLAERKPHPISNLPEVSVIFCWSRDTPAGDWLDPKMAQPMLDLYMYCRRWMTDMQGVYMHCGVCDDLRSDTIENLWLSGRGTPGSRSIIARPYKKAAR